MSSASLAAYVLHHYDWSESSLILDLFTRAQGRVVAVAKGAKKPHSQLRAVLLPFQRIQVSLGRLPEGEGAGEIQTLRQAEWGGGAAMPGGAALFSGFYLNELLMKLLARHDPHPALFDAYAQTLPSLVATDDASVQRALRAFELTLLRQCGLLPDLSRITATQAAVEADARYVLRAEAGLDAARDGEAGVAGATWVTLQAALEHGSLEALRRGCGAALAGLRTQLRAQLHYHLGTPTMRTRQVMLGLQDLE